MTPTEIMDLPTEIMDRPTEIMAPPAKIMDPPYGNYGPLTEIMAPGPRGPSHRRSVISVRDCGPNARHPATKVTKIITLP